MAASAADQRWMALALSLGRRGQGRVWPNPAVGCVIIAQNRVVGRGWTQAGGRPHAETMALSQAGDRARAATVYVTLEPCSHHAQTPPCTDALISAGVARVVAAMQDPYPAVDGAGFKKLRSVGIEVDVLDGPVAEQAQRDHAGFVSRILNRRPTVTLKLASSVDGRIATATGESRWITGPSARRLVHGLRARHDAVMVGGGTMRADDPALTVRGLGPTRQPVRVVLSRRLSLPRDSQMAATANEVPVWLCHGTNTEASDLEFWGERGATLLACNTGPGGQLDPISALKALGEKGLTRVFCEGGGTLAASLLAADLVDRLVTFTAGVAIGAEGRPEIGAMGVASLAEAPRFELEDSHIIGGDVMLTWRRA